MKKILLIIILVPILSFNSIATEINIIGKWTGEDEKQNVGFMTFDDEGYATFEIEGEVIGGKEFEMSGKKGSMTYSVNFDVKPVQIDLILTMTESKDQMKMLFIAEFQNNDTMILASNFNDIRPSEFTTDNSITLLRIKQ